jgi:hypothetical protein
MVIHVCNIAENFFAMQNAKPLKQEKEKKQDAEPMDSELSVLLDTIRLKNFSVRKSPGNKITKQFRDQKM